ncbi:multidrug ABC transporter ATP-binding protein [Alkalihalophilus pseudofirmus]|uniref:ABC transporter ATP-binding protein n=1 Tax=Alkalihalophilus TaxID=2893060 RepID=UPI0009524A9D|nr:MULTISPECIES: ABC transporter ATP-binding protein [Alkalihalophilus]MED1599972.1 ABC transporter ATP-binding protein [Alkalihalophilus marmarensis]OLS34284.1 multidrug ABC transporter ATP-binding protein [Alkalihalophilus pseudofirmus]WEG17520.1 ABC transporter ATP-binding protein [Alkalihalophilus pseudofirmus]
MNSMKRYMAFVKPYWKQIFWTIVIGVLKFGIPLLLPLVMMYVIDDIILVEGMPQDEKLSTLFWIMGGMFFIFLVLRPPIEYLRQYYAQWIGSKVLYDIRDQLFTHIQKLSLRFYSNRKVGEIISRVIHDVEQTKNFVITGLMNIWLDLFTIIIAIIIMLNINVWLTLVAISMFPLYGFSVKFFYARLRHLTRVRSQALAEVQGHLHERVQGMNVIRSFALEEHEQHQFAKRNNHFLDRALDHTRWNAKTFAVVNTITDLAPLLVIVVSGYFVITGNLEIGAMTAFVLYMERLYGPLRRLVNSSTTLTQAIASMDRVFEFIDEKYDIEDSLDAKPLDSAHGRVQFEDVSFYYDNEEKPVLKNVSLDIKEGETVAFVGMSGGGKSTLISLIPRFYDVSSGRITLDGVDIRHFQVRMLRDKIGMVLQDNILFSDSVKMNILMGNPEATDEEVIAAAKAANAHDFIMNLPNGYDTEVGERGVKLSGGQKQRVAIARVFLKNPPILIFDEATSALDLESEHYIQEALEKLARNRTTFIVAHRLSTITHADRIVLIENGEIVESGTHEELMKKAGHYQKLFDVQQLS